MPGSASSAGTDGSEQHADEERTRDRLPWPLVHELVGDFHRAAGLVERVLLRLAQLTARIVEAFEQPLARGTDAFAGVTSGRLQQVLRVRSERSEVGKDLVASLTGGGF